MRGSLKQTQTMSVRLIFLIGLLIIQNCVFSRSVELPCKFFDTVNITEGQQLNNKSIIFDGVEYPNGQYAEFDYITNNDIDHTTVEPHIRGCLCNRKPCLNLCCPLGTISDIANGQDICIKNNEVTKLEGEILDQNNDTHYVKYNQVLSIVDYKPCSGVFSAKGDYRITYDGLVLYEDDSYTHDSYCFKVEDNGKPGLTLALCSGDPSGDDGSRPIHVSISMILSVICIVATLLVYGCIKKLRNLNGRCLMRYLSVLGIGYTLIAWVQINVWGPENLFCSYIGYIVYFSFISAFSWLSVINFDTWLNSKTIVLRTGQNVHLNFLLNWLTNNFKNYKEHKQLKWYMLYGYGVPCVMVALIYTIDHIESIPDQFRPRIGVNGCLMREFWPSFLYFNLLIGIILTINVALFVLTTMNFHQVHQQAKRMTSHEDGTHIRITLSQKKDVYKLYLRLSVVAGVTWIMEVISFLIISFEISISKVFQVLLDVFDTLNALQGVFIFILFIVRRRVFCLIRERWNELWGTRNANRTRRTP